QLRLAASAGYLCAGLPETRPVYVLKDDTSECLHASNTEGIPAGQPNPVNFEIYHRPLPDNNDPSDLWHFGALGSGKSATSQAFGRLLHASDRSEEHTSELQSLAYLVCRLLLEKKK